MIEKGLRKQRRNTRMSYPPLPSKIGKRGSNNDDGNKQYFTVLDEVTQVQSTYPGKVIFLQRIQFENDSRIELRLGYYIMGKKPSNAGKWVWGQYAPMMPAKDFQAIVRKAIEKGWI